MKKLVKLILVFSLVSTLFLNPLVIDAAKANTLAALRADLKEMEAQKAKNDRAKKLTTSQIDQASKGIDSAQKEITTNRGKVEAAKIKVEESNKEIDKQKANMKEVIYAYQLATGNNEYLEYVFNADNLTDLIYRFSVSEQLIEWQQTEIKKFEALVRTNEKLQVDLANREVALNKEINNLESRVVKLGNQLAAITEISVDLVDDIKSAKEYIKFVEKAGCGENQDIDYCLRVVTDTGFRWPLNSGRLTSPFGYRKDPLNKKRTVFHNAIDIGGNAEGTKVFASAAGVVGKIIRKASCGGNSVFVWHNVNGKKYTTQYTHLLSIRVKIGDVVTSESVVGTVGGGSQTRSYDKCSTGAHLHFAMATGHYGGAGSNSYSSYSTYLTRCFDAQKFLGLPAKGVTFSGR
ncbi:MAG: peptidoglycan DD-metalloendopeptidase family protein [Mollicutes bacterium]|jgi:murein DD-endopeptidase MepM/ murein hydrolase activator NlpD|nr:peptidoglycan DD-metalloendopeptidase family protein [Mollicutes bacterium]